MLELLTKRQLEIVKILFYSVDDYVNRMALADRLGVSEKTVRNEIKELNAKAEKIKMQKGRGYYLTDRDWAKETLANYKDNGLDRDILILKTILTGEKVNFFELADQFYISESTLSKTIVKLNSIMYEDFNSRIIRKNNHLFLDRDATTKRKILTHFLLNEVDNQDFDISVIDHYLENIDVYTLKDLLLAHIEGRNIKILDYAFITLLLHIALILERKKTGINYAQESGPALKTDGKSHVAELCVQLEREFNLNLTAEDRETIELLFEIKSDSGTIEKDITPYISFVELALEELAENYDFDFKNDEALIHKLANHFRGLEVRCSHNSYTRNPLLLEIQKKFTLIYDMSSSIADYFQEKTGFRVSEDEIGYIALHIIGALEKIKEVHLNIGIINPFDASLTKMIADDILRKYADATFTSVSMFDIHHVNFINFDLVISFVQMEWKYDTPILFIDHYLTDKTAHKIDFTIKEVRKKKVYGDFKIKNYFSEKIFFPDLNILSKNKVLKFLANSLFENGYTNENFLTFVQRREEVSPTSFGKPYAIPHPVKKIALKNGIAVGILRNPIDWGNGKVKIIFLFSLHESFDQVPKLYDYLLNALDNPEKFNQLTQAKTFKEFIAILFN